MSELRPAAAEGPRRYGFVLPRWFPGIAGGAETLAGELARHLAAEGYRIEVLTTCARDHRTWENEFPAGRESAAGMTIERFAVDPRDIESWLPLQISISEGMKVEIADQLRWMGHSVNSSGLYAHLAAHAESYDALFFAPYLFGTTFWGSLIAPERAVLIPCLHDEHYAYQEIIASMFRQVRGALFNSVPEQELASRLYGPLRGGEVGMGFDLLPPAEIEALTPYLEGGAPYLLYLGRKELGKNVSLLLDLFVAGKEQGLLPAELVLVVAGGGSFGDLRRDELRGRQDITDLEHLSEHDKRRLLRHALLLVQPSVNESFSIVLMEAWRLGTPVLVHGGCPVTRDHVVRSGGGLYFTDAVDLCGAVRRIAEDRALRTELAAAGRRYVEERYSWESVLERFHSVMTALG